MNLSVQRILDANANRAREALRVFEDVARFTLNDGALSAELKTMRHDLAAILNNINANEAILSRDTPQDVGTQISTPAEYRRAGIADIAIAAGKRLSEALRVLEEVAKISDSTSAGGIEKLRYRGYTIEQTLVRATRQLERFSKVCLYVLLTESLCRLTWEETLDAILAGGAQCVQLREKNLPDDALLKKATRLTEKCRRAGALAIINDRPDIALLSGAHGIHLGQTDLPCHHVRRLVGHDMLIGVSTENVEQARQAARAGASYIAAGPMFQTATKEKPRIAGPEYAAEVLKEIELPVVAIGGITSSSIPELTTVGVRAVAVCGYVISAENPEARCRELRRLIS